MPTVRQNSSSVNEFDFYDDSWMDNFSRMVTSQSEGKSLEDFAKEASRTKPAKSEIFEFSMSDASDEDCEEGSQAGNNEAAIQPYKALQKHAEVKRTDTLNNSVVEQPSNSLSPSRGRSAANILATNIKPKHWVIPGFLPEGLAFLAGPPKAGKTWLAMMIAVSSATGRSLFGIKVSQHSVLYIDFESDEGGIQERLNEIRDASMPIDALDHLFFGSDWPNIKSGGLEALNEYLTEYSDVKLVVIDTLALFRGVINKRGNAYELEYEATKPIHQLAQRHHCCILLITHTRKGQSDNFVSSVTGTHAGTGAADTVMVLQPSSSQNNLAVLNVTGRRVKQQTHYLELRDDPNTEWVIVEGVGDSPSQKSKIRPSQQPVYDLLKKAGSKGMTGSEIKAALQSTMTREAFQLMVSRMAAQGILEKLGGGRYRFKEEAQ